MNLGKKSYKISRWLHKYPGLLLLIFLAWMSVSGVLLNHPVVIRSASVPKSIVPKQYHPENWNRSAMKGIVYTDSNTFYTYGNQGVFFSNDKGNTFTPFMKGEFSKRAWKKRTNHLVYLKETQQLIAATNNGLLICELPNTTWEEISLPKNHEPVKKILEHNNNITVVTESALYNSAVIDSGYRFSRFIPEKKILEEQIPLFRAFLELHDGSIWGVPGILLWDTAGIILFFLCLSAFYIWYFPKKWKRQYKQKQIVSSANEKSKRSFHLKYHKKLGWYAAVFLLIIFTTGIFLRPPLLISIARKSINAKFYPSIKNSNPWHHKINNALFNSQNNQIVLECSDGLWAGNIGNQQPYIKINLPVKIFAMGATVFEEDCPGKWLIGSFGGLQLFDLADSSSTSLFQLPPSNNPGRPGSLLLTGYIQTPYNTSYALGHYKGLCDLKGNPVPDIMPMPEIIKQNYKMPLWNFMFELHNGRIFKGLLGGFYMLIIPLGGILGILVLISGVFDYWYVKLRSRKKIK